MGFNCFWSRRKKGNSSEGIFHPVLFGQWESFERVSFYLERQLQRESSEYKSSRIFTGNFQASNQSQSAPSRPEEVEPSSVVRPSQAASGSKRDFQGELSSSSRPVAKAKGPNSDSGVSKVYSKISEIPTFVSFFGSQRPGRETYFGLQRSRGQVKGACVDIRLASGG